MWYWRWQSFAANNESRFPSPKTGQEESKLLQESISKSTAYRTKWAIKKRRSDDFNFFSFTKFDVKIFVNEKKWTGSVGDKYDD